MILVAYFPPQPHLKPAVVARLKAEYRAELARAYPALAIKLIEAKGEPYIMTARGERFNTHVPPPIIGPAGFDSRRWFIIWPLAMLVAWLWLVEWLAK
jgi:hypothetical protein